MTGRDALWGLLDAVCAPATEPPPMDPVQAELKERVDRRYPDVMVWKRDKMVASGELVVLTTYASPMHRILVRPFRGSRWTATFFWADGAWSSVTFDTKWQMDDLIQSKAARNLGWPDAEVM